MDLLERESHLAQLEEHRRQAAAGHGRLVLVGGEAGVGKTTLVDAFCRRMAADASPLRMSCDSLSTPSPLAPALDLAPRLGLPIERPPADSDERDRLFRAILEALAARPELTVAIGEDAHWAGGVSLEFLRFLARRIGDVPVLFVVTYRDDEVGPTHPLRRLLGDLATAQTVHRLSVPPLSQEAVRRWAAESGRDPAALHRLTGGNPFFLAASDDPVLVRQAVAGFEDLGAAPALGRAMRRLRELGVRDLPPLRRGPRESTRANPAGLTQREAEVLALLAEGLRNAEIAERLFLTPKTVSHHLSAIYAKLGVSTRTEAAHAYSQLGVAPV